MHVFTVYIAQHEAQSVHCQQLKTWPGLGKAISPTAKQLFDGADAQNAPGSPGRQHLMFSGRPGQRLLGERPSQAATSMHVPSAVPSLQGVPVPSARADVHAELPLETVGMQLGMAHRGIPSAA
jgi:hypothetical protein